jgi:hypothetical protein
MKTRFLPIVLIVLGMIICMPQRVDSKEKKKYEWNWDGTKSGNEDFDEYLLKVDTLWNKIKTYHETLDKFTYKEDTLSVDGKYYVVAYMTTDEGQYVTRSTVNWQFSEAILQSSQIVLDATDAALLTTSATMALPSLGLNALSFGKYLKGGPVVIGRGTGEMKTVWSLRKQQAKRWKAMKEDAVDPSTLSLNLTESQVKLLNKCAFIKEYNETSDDYQMISEVQKNKTEEQLQAERDAFANSLASAIILPEDEAKMLDDISDEAFQAAVEKRS